MNANYTMSKAIEDARNAGYLTITDCGDNSDGETSEIADAAERFDLDYEEPEGSTHEYEYLDSGIIEERRHGEATGWYLQLGK